MGGAFFALPAMLPPAGLRSAAFAVIVCIVAVALPAPAVVAALSVSNMYGVIGMMFSVVLVYTFIIYYTATPVRITSS